MADPIQDLPGEIWKPVVGLESMYKVSNMGRVASLRLGRLIYVRTNPGGYQYVKLYLHKRTFVPMVHRVVLEAFVGPRPNGLQCRHLDGNKTNNALLNLCWGTPQENADDKRRIVGLRGEEVPPRRQRRGSIKDRAPLTERTAREMRAKFRAAVMSLATEYNVLPCHVWNVITRRAWKHLPWPS